MWAELAMFCVCQRMGYSSEEDRKEEKAVLMAAASSRIGISSGMRGRQTLK